MSKINTLRVADDVKSPTTIYTPIIEAVVNSIQAIVTSENKSRGEIKIIFARYPQKELSAQMSKSDFYSVKILDNGIGFNKQNLDSFDTFRSDFKIEIGGKGFGRFMYIKYFENVSIESIFVENSKFKKVDFDFGKDDNIIENVEYINLNSKKIGSKISLDTIRGKHTFPKELDTIAKVVLEKLLVYFISNNDLPEIKLIEKDAKKEIILNNVLNNNSEIQEIVSEKFTLKKSKSKEEFEVRIFKIYSPNKQKSKVILTADSREVLYTNLQEYIPEFEDEFIDTEKNKDDKEERHKNFIIKAYVLGGYLNKEVVTERNNFNFEQNSDMFHLFSRADIEKKTVEIVRKALSDRLESRKVKKQKKVEEYLKENPFYREYKSDIEWDLIKMNPSKEHIEMELHKIKYSQEVRAKREINTFLKDFDTGVEEKIEDVFSAIHKAKKSDLAHYISLRRVFLDILKKSLEINDDKINHKKEDIVHSIIFPTKKDSDDTKFKDHNLWILDERLSFTDYLRSDMPISKEEADRPDMISFNQRIAYRGGQDASNPITIFEFKKPGRDDFYSNKAEDPKQQIIRYIEQIKSKTIRNFKDREILVGEHTPFYAYIIADYTNKTESWLRQNQFKPLPNKREWVLHDDFYNLTLYFIDWEQLVKNAEERNNTFFHYLGI